MKSSQVTCVYIFGHSHRHPLGFYIQSSWSTCKAIAFCHASLEHLIDPRLACIQALHPLAAPLASANRLVLLHERQPAQRLRARVLRA